MKDIIKLKNDFKDYEFSIVVLTSVVNPKVDFKDVPQDERLHKKDLTQMLWNDTIPGILKNSIDEKFELIIVDNGSCEEHKTIIRNISSIHQPTRLVFNNENFGVAPGWNSGLKLCRGEYICIVSDDYILNTHNFLRILQAPMLIDNEVVITGPETAQLGSDGMSRQLWRLPYVDYSAVNCCMFRHSFLKKVGYLDENFWPYMAEDADIGWLANSYKYKVMKVDLQNSTHWGSSSVYRYWTNEEIDEIWKTNREYLIKKHEKYLKEREQIDERYK